MACTAPPLGIALQARHICKLEGLAILPPLMWVSGSRRDSLDHGGNQRVERNREDGEAGGQEAREAGTIKGDNFI